jgi:hypothetical protein
VFKTQTVMGVPKDLPLGLDEAGYFKLSGGLLVKYLNARGDRVIHAPELLRELGVPDSAEFAVAARCDAEFGARVWPSLAADLQSTFSRFERDGR